MLNISDELKEIFRTDVLPIRSTLIYKEIELYFPSINLTIGLDKMVQDSFELTESLCSSEQLDFGSCESSQFKVQIADIEQDLNGLWFTATMYVDNKRFSLPLGTYKVDSCEKTSDRRFKQIIAYDSLYNLTTDVSSWYNSILFPITVKNMRESLLSYLGIPFDVETLPNDSVFLSKTLNPSVLIARDILYNLCRINAGFGHIGRNGKFRVLRLTGLGLYPSEELYPSEDLFPAESVESMGGSATLNAGYIESQYEDYYTKALTGVKIVSDDEDVGTLVGETENVYLMNGNFLLFGKDTTEIESIANEILYNVKYKYYRPHNTKLIGLPYMEVGDSINIITTNDAIESFIYERTLTGFQSLIDVYSAKGTETRDNTHTKQSEYQQIQGKILRINKSIDEVSVELTDLEKDVNSKITQTAESLQTQITNNKNNTESSITQLDDEINLKVSKGDVSSQLSLEPDRVYLRGNRLVIESTNFKLDSNGNAVFSGDVVGATFTGGTINGSEIISRSGQGDLTLKDGMLSSSYLGQNMVISASGMVLSLGSTPKASYSVNGIFGQNVEGTTGNFNNVICNMVNGYLPITEQNLETKVSIIITPSYISQRLPNYYTDDIRISGGSISGQIAFYNGNGVGWDYAERTYQKSSDKRLKYDIEPLEDVTGFYMELESKKYRFKDGFDKNVINTGLIADEVKELLEKHNIESGMVYSSPNVLNQNEYCPDGWHYNLKYEDLHSFHIKMIQKHESKIQEQEETITQQENKIKELESRLEKLESMLLTKGV